MHFNWRQSTECHLFIAKWEIKSFKFFFVSIYFLFVVDLMLDLIFKWASCSHIFGRVWFHFANTISVLIYASGSPGLLVKIQVPQTLCNHRGKDEHLKVSKCLPCLWIKTALVIITKQNNKIIDKITYVQLVTLCFSFSCPHSFLEEPSFNQCYPIRGVMRKTWWAACLQSYRPRFNCNVSVTISDL